MLPLDLEALADAFQKSEQSPRLGVQPKNPQTPCLLDIDGCGSLKLTGNPRSYQTSLRVLVLGHPPRDSLEAALATLQRTTIELDTPSVTVSFELITTSLEDPEELPDTPNFVLLCAPEGILPAASDLTATRLAQLTDKLGRVFAGSSQQPHGGPRAILFVLQPLFDADFFARYRARCVERGTPPIALQVAPSSCDRILDYIEFETRAYLEQLMELRHPASDDIAEISPLEGVELDL
jgi:hypothetical protein